MGQILSIGGRHGGSMRIQSIEYGIEELEKGSNGPSTRNLVTNEERMRPSIHWLGSVLYDSFSDLTAIGYSL